MVVSAQVKILIKIASVATSVFTETCAIKIKVYAWRAYYPQIIGLL